MITQQRPFQVKQPLPRRGAFKALRKQVVDYLIAERPAVGERFLSDQELMQESSLSRMTVRKALSQLQREGWIERHNGRGTFIGPRANMPVSHRQPEPSSQRRIARLALAVPFGSDARHWFVAPLLDGIMESAAEQGISVELLFSQRIDIRQVSQRLMQHRPDMVAGVLAVPRIELVLSEAQRLEIPCVIAADRFAEMEQPNVYEDSVQGATLAVRHLVAQGHKRIGFVQSATRAWWVFDRRQGYLNGLAEAGLEADERMTLWLPPFDFAPGSPMIHTDAIRQYLDRQQPTAIVCGCCSPLMQMSPLISSGKLSVPRDLSVVTFDNCPQIVEWLGGVRPTMIAQPMREIGRCLARMARQVVDGGKLERETSLPCLLIEGDSVRDMRTGSAVVPAGETS